MLKRHCPFIGLKKDTGTTMGYPSLRNRCHRVNPPKPVDPPYQDKYCFTFEHRHCSVLLDDNPDKLPPEIAAKKSK
jgi:hypothetical protein